MTASGNGSASPQKRTTARAFRRGMSINETARNRLTSTDASASASSAKVYRSDAAGDDRAKMGHVVVASDHMPESVERRVDNFAAAVLVHVGIPD